MAGITRHWACEHCSAAMTSGDWPEEAICDRCERKRLRTNEAQAVNFCAAVAMAHVRDEDEKRLAKIAMRVAARLGEQAL